MMTSIPIPIVVAMMLALLGASNHHQLRETSSGRLFALMLYTYAFSMVFIGLRWSQDAVVFLRIAATLAVISTVLLYLAFRSLGRQPAFTLEHDWLHLLPPALMAAVALINPDWTDPILVLIKLGYAALLIQLARRAPASLQLTRLDWLRNSELALWGAAILLIISVVVDIVIAVDFILYQGQHAPSLVGFVNLFSVLLIGWAAVQAGRGSIEEESTPAANTDTKSIDSVDHDGGAALLEKLNSLLIRDQLYADTNLNLQKIARKAGIPSRTISRTINAQTKQNVSQWVNNARINAACEMLHNKSTTVTQVMADSGFLTKSNFNREFKRVKDCSPSEWRNKQQ